MISLPPALEQIRYLFLRAWHAKNFKNTGILAKRFDDLHAKIYSGVKIKYLVLAEGWREIGRYDTYKEADKARYDYDIAHSGGSFATVKRVCVRL